MSARNILTANAIFALLTALVLIFAPAVLAGFFNIPDDAVVHQVIQLFGAACVGYGLSSWWMRNSSHSEARTAFLRGGGVGYIVVSIVSAYTLFNGLAAPIAWGAVIIIFVWGVMFLYPGMRNTGTE